MLPAGETGPAPQGGVPGPNRSTKAKQGISPTYSIDQRNTFFPGLGATLGSPKDSPIESRPAGELFCTVCNVRRNKRDDQPRPESPPRRKTFLPKPLTDLLLKVAERHDIIAIPLGPLTLQGRLFLAHITLCVCVVNSFRDPWHSSPQSQFTVHSVS